MAAPRHRFTPFVLLVALFIGGCREEGDIKIHSLDFEGVTQVDPAWVLAFAESHALSPLSRREALKHLERGATPARP